MTDRESLSRLASSDVDEAAGRPVSADARIVPVWAGARAAGPAWTVDARDLSFLGTRRAVMSAPAGSVLVIAGGGRTERALFGGMLARLAMLRGLAGTVIDGCARDREEIVASRYPVFSLGLVPTPPFKQLDGPTQVPVPFGGLEVSPGDLVVADGDGVAVVPAAEADEVAARALALADAGDAAFRALCAEAGVTPPAQP